MTNMATHQPLLLSEAPKSSLTKVTLFVLTFSFAAILGLIVLYASDMTAPITTLKSDLSFHQLICDPAKDRPSCIAHISELVNQHTNSSVNQQHFTFLESLLRKSTSQIQAMTETVKEVNLRVNEPRHQAALLDCLQLMDLSLDRILDSIAALKIKSTPSDGNSYSSLQDAHTWLSTVLTNHVTCLDGLDGSARRLMENELQDLISRPRTSLALFVAMFSGAIKTTGDGEFPSWVTSKERKLLEASGDAIQADVVVAKDGSGKYKTVKEAVAAAPDKSKTRYIIHVKKGTYKENVEIGKNKKNLMIVGDGKDSTVITGSLNVVDGSTTFRSATVAAVGDGFIAQDIRFKNTAGPQKHQAVALRVGADTSVINRCRIDAYQDTLYTHSNRQFYRDSHITGTVDFIFGNAAVVFQNCQMVARKPMDKQSNMVTAQGREDPNQNTGTSIQQCKIIASSDLESVKNKIKTYLGRPWKEYSRTVVMQSYIGDHIDPAGWSVWSGDFALKTLYYGEYMNNGPGAGTSNRVKWAGYHIIKSAKEASKFTVAALIQGGTWLKSTGVKYIEGL